ncbi:MAG: S-methyl-5'-thioadenosine phosphorylase [Dehalococcoidia bacterium]|nr:S-methyl-5'-thioadenosine phosphorylase [Dehalococcoidia bacterium]
MVEARIGVIGGSGLYQMEGLSKVCEVTPETPFGPPSDAITVGELQGVPVAFLPRHGRGHRLGPSEVPSLANIFALKLLGVERVISVAAVGSLAEQVHPLDLVIPTQLIDWTRQRPKSFFRDGIAVHVGFADPFCGELSGTLAAAANGARANLHTSGTLVVIEGPAFSTRAESALYRSWGGTIIGMTALPEAQLAREAEMCYSILASVTDYDVWHQQHEAVSVEMVLQNLLRNAAVSAQVLRNVIPSIPKERRCGCSSALKDAIVTSKDAISPDAKRRLGPLLQKYLRS